MASQIAVLMVGSNADIAGRLVRLRKTLRMSQADICRRLDVAPNRWNQYESGDRRITIEIAGRLRDKFGVTADWIYFGDESGLPQRLIDKFLEAAE